MFEPKTYPPQEGACEFPGQSCPGMAAPRVPDRYSEEINNVVREAYLHAECAREREMDI